ncbi:MAG: 6-carboxytetrahydropterin synthase QueD [Terriglobales bacterium]
MFEVSVEETFSAGHALRGYRGKCENPHGHNYRVRVRLRGDQLDAIGLLQDFADIKIHLRAIVATFDHQFLNDLPDFSADNPSAENIAKRFYDLLRPRLLAPGARLAAVTVYETDTTSATYSEG